MFKKIITIKSILLITLFGIALVLASLYLPGKQSDALAQTASPDAIAIRVIKNPENYSALRWYQEQNFTGSPQSTTVDGYEAVRDGRTVYVNAANIIAGVLYTNVYLISYNQDAEKDTQDIFGRILSHWKFNTNYTATDFCDVSNTKVCLYDTDCPNDEFCQSEKAKIIRDTRRLADLAEIRLGLEKFRSERGAYPKLSAGSYLPNKTLSTWPSWQNVLAQELKMKLPADPVNKLGDCGANYHPITCWDEKQRSFADSDPADPNLNLPNDSLTMVYTSDSFGSSYDLCAVMESTYVSGAGGGVCADNNVENQPPVFTRVSFPQGYSGYAYDAYLEAIDPDGDTLTWSFSSNPAGQWAAWPSAPSMQDTPVINQKQIHADTAGAGGTYAVTVSVDDGRGAANSVFSQTFNFTVLNLPPQIMASDREIRASSTNPIDYRLTASDDVSNYPLAHTLTGTLPPNWSQSFNLAGSIYELNITGIIDPVLHPIPVDADFNYNISITDSYGGAASDSFVISVLNDAPSINAGSRTIIVGSNSLVSNPIIILVADTENNSVSGAAVGTLPPGLGPIVKVNNHRFEISGIPNGPTPAAIAFPVDITMRDEYGALSSRSIVITIDNDKPVIAPISCPSAVRQSHAYTCSVSASDPNGHTISGYTLTPGSYPTGLSVNSSGTISGNPSQVGVFNMTVSATDQYAAVSNGATAYLAVNNYCGDNTRQTPNTEHRGGPGDDGQEDCDGTDGVAISPANSNVNRQYECTSPPACPISGACLGTCSFTGGYCGDGTVQNAHGEQCEGTAGGTGGYACSDCAWSGGTCGDGIVQTAYGEQCEAGGSGSGPNDQWRCNSLCKWYGGYCGDTYCELGFESSLSCPGDCGASAMPSNFVICTDLVNQPACYPGGFVTPQITWIWTAAPNDYCDCNGSPADDCPFGTPCEAAHQTAYRVQLDNNADYSSPEFDSGIVTSGNSFHDVSVPGLQPATLYHFRASAQDQFGSWSAWAECTGPFFSSPAC